MIGLPLSPRFFVGDSFEYITCLKNSYRFLLASRALGPDGDKFLLSKGEESFPVCLSCMVQRVGISLVLYKDLFANYRWRILLSNPS